MIRRPGRPNLFLSSSLNLAGSQWVRSFIIRGVCDMGQTEGRRLIAALQDPAVYEHPTDRFILYETHANWVLLTGPYAYKVKKPVNYGFLDFSTLEKRRHYCEEEVRLNRRLAPELYEGVVPITGTPDEPRLGGEGEPFEYAVKITQFDPGQRLDHVLERGELTAAHIDAMAEEIARFHNEVPVAHAASEYGSPQRLQHAVEDNFRDIRPTLDEADGARVDRIQVWSESRFQALRAQLEARREAGWIRECHGDLHLANMVLWEDRVRIFDCLEFNDALRWIDTASEAAFLIMDLQRRGRPDLAARWRTLYFEWLGDYDAVPLLPYYQAYRAMVRAKVASLTAQQPGLTEEERERQRAEAGTLARLAASYQEAGDPRVIITHGVSGSGKSTVGLGLLEQLGAWRIRSDVERKRLFGLDPLARATDEVGEGIYRYEASRKTYQRLAQLARKLLDCGQPVLVDAAFLERDMRDLLRHVAVLHEVPFTILHTTAAREVLGQRVQQRAESGRDVSDANLNVLESQFGSMEALEGDEKPYTVEVNTAEPVDYHALMDHLRHHARVPSE